MTFWYKTRFTYLCIQLLAPLLELKWSTGYRKLSFKIAQHLIHIGLLSKFFQIYLHPIAWICSWQNLVSKIYFSKTVTVGKMCVTPLEQGYFSFLNRKNNRIFVIFDEFFTNFTLSARQTFFFQMPFVTLVDRGEFALYKQKISFIHTFLLILEDFYFHKLNAIYLNWLLEKLSKCFKNKDLSKRFRWKNPCYATDHGHLSPQFSKLWIKS